MATQSSKWRDILDLISKLSVALIVPVLITSFTWVKTTEARIAVVEARQTDIVKALNDIALVSHETAQAISDLRVSIAEVDHK